MIEATTAIQRLPEDVLIIIPVRDVVLFPNAILPISVGREKSILGVQEAMRSNRQVGVILQRDAKDNDPDEEALHKTGTTANILRYLKSSEGSINMLVTGDQRFRILQFLPDLPFLVARIELVTEPRSIGADISARARYLKQRAEETLQLLPNEAGTFLASALIEVSDAGVLADGVTARMDIPPDEKQKVLDAIDLKERLDRVIDNLSEYLNVLRLYREIEDQTRGKFNAEKRERILREQLETIRHELGDDGQRLNGKDFQHVIDEAEMPEAVANEVKKEAARLMRTNEQSPEYAMLRTWIELMVELPWNRQDEENIDIAHARAVLDADHYGMEKVKRRILEFLAVKKLKPRGKSPILCLVGPPGVGKTSLGKSIARAIGVKFTRTSLGGVHDEAEIRGHRRTYIGALSGVVIRNLHKCGSRNPVFMLDEIDKMGYGVHGDPASALLEVLDPEQNFSFVDNYLGLPFDLSSVFFIATANVIDAIPVALSDRMEVIEIPGYTAEEKLEIAKRYLVSRQQEENGLQANQAVIDDDALKILIESYTREAGVRNLERQISALLRNAAVQIAEGKQQKIRITKTEANDILGPYIFEQETAMLAGITGVATGLAWTPVGGDILFVEATRAQGKGEFILTGQLGDVMKESAQAALSLVKSRAVKLGIGEVFENSDIHVHVPAGAIQKDGPSAGLAIFIALVSLFTKRPVHNDIAMTGEISLRGLILPVGGIKKKCLAALRSGITQVALPARNKKDLPDIPESAREKIEFIWLSNVDEAIEIALEKPAAKGTGAYRFPLEH